MQSAVAADAPAGALPPLGGGPPIAPGSAPGSAPSSRRWLGAERAAASVYEAIACRFGGRFEAQIAATRAVGLDARARMLS